MNQVLRWGLMACVLALTTAGVVRAQPKTELDKKVTAILVEVIDKGVDLYNSGDHPGCYRLYEGALLSLKPFLADKPEWQKAIDAGIADAAKQPSLATRAVALRQVMDKIYFEINPKKETPPPVTTAEVSGKITLDGKGVAADVSLVPEKGDTLKTKSGADGTYKLDKVTLGKYGVTVSGGDVAKKFGDAKSSGLTADVKDAKTTLDLKVTAEPKPEPKDSEVSGKVTLDGKGVAGDVTLVPEKGTALKGIVAADGTYKFDKVPAGKYAVTVSGTGIDKKFGDAKTSGLKVEVKDAKQTLDLKVSAEPKPEPPKESELSGKVTLDGKPVAKADVSLVPATGAAIKGKTGDDGAYKFDKVPAGKYGVTVSGTGVDKKFGDAKTSGLTAEVKDPKQTLDVKVTAEKLEQSMWDRLGGETGVGKVVDDFMETAVKDPKVNFDRGGKFKLDDKAVAGAKKSLVTMISSATGGPLKYDGKSMKEAHKGMGITEGEFDAAAVHFKAALEKNGVKKEDVDALLKAVGETKKDIVEAKKPDPEPKPEAKTGEVSGTVTLKGKPLSAATISLVDDKGKEIAGAVNTKGEFKLEKVPAGTFKVVVKQAPGDPKPALPVPAKYSDVKTSGLVLEVKEGKNVYDLLLKE